MTLPASLPTGNDPRTCTDYATLRDEMGKLAHPARPDVDWLYAERLCQALFAQNGVDLQTAAWYTLARTHNAGMSGLNDGLSLLETLLLHQWPVIWPQALATRKEIITTLTRRLQGILRGWLLADTLLPELERAEQHLLSLRDTLVRFGVREGGGSDALYQQLRYAGAQLRERSPLTSGGPEGSALATEVTVAAPAVAPWRQRLPSEITDNGLSSAASPALLKSFLAGAGCALLVTAMVLSGTAWYQQTQRAREQLALQHQQQQRRIREATPLSSLQPWQQGMAQLQRLTDQLNGLDGQRGKYLTVSELKSSVFSAMQAFNRSVPVEEQLRRYAAGEDVPDGGRAQTGILLQRLQYRYQLLQQAEQQAIASDTATVTGPRH